MSDLDNISDLLICSESEDEKDTYPILFMGDKKRSKSFHDIIQEDSLKENKRLEAPHYELKNKHSNKKFIMAAKAVFQEDSEVKDDKEESKVEPKTYSKRKFDKNEYFDLKIQKARFYDIKDIKETNEFIDQYRELKIEQDFENQTLMEKMPKERYNKNYFMVVSWKYRVGLKKVKEILIF